MRLTPIVLANGARESSNNLWDLKGAGLYRITVPGFPAKTEGWAFASLELDISERDRGFEWHLLVRDTESEKIISETPRTPASVSMAHVKIVSPWVAIVPKAGIYALAVMINDEELGYCLFHVVPNPSS